MSTYNKAMIKEKAQSGLLIKTGFDETKIKEACYEASTSNAFFEVTEKGTKRVVIENGKHYILRPNCQVVCVTHEYFDIPLDCIARIFLIGHYFALGIAPVNTYADPGFKGHLGIVLSNTSRNYLKIGPNEKIAKIEFAQMLSPSTEGYVGQHGGDVMIWPFREDMIANEDTLNEYGINPKSSVEIEKIYGKDLKSAIFSARNFTWRLAVATLLAAVLPMLSIWAIQSKFKIDSPILNIVFGIICGVIANWIFFFLIKKEQQ